MSSIQKHAGMMAMYEQTRLKSDFTASIPTNDGQVKLQLRELEQPICLFGEDAFLRRERLKLLLGGSAGVSATTTSTIATTSEPTKQTETFYTHGSQSLLRVRKQISQVSAPVHAVRLEKERSRLPIENSSISEAWSNGSVYPYSQIGDTRPLSSVSFSNHPSGNSLVAVSSWSGNVNLFNSNDLTKVKSIRAHEDRCTGIAWSLHDKDLLVSGGCDKRVCLWNTREVGGSTGAGVIFEGHEMRINKVSFHPICEQLLFSTSDDETWRMWDLNRKEEVLLQEGHAGGVFGISIHPDGSLIATSDVVGVIRVWDLRTGRSILDFQGHAEQVLALDFSPNGYNLASCSGDNSVRIWDLRRKECAEILPGHTKLVSAVKFDRMNGGLLMTASYDCIGKIWRTRDYKIVKNLPIHESRIMGADFHSSGLAVVTACYDRTFKVWSASPPTGKTEVADDGFIKTEGMVVE